MRTATLQRLQTSDAGTFGELSTPDGLDLVTLEPPWRDNARGRSCLPPGDYECRWHESPTFGWVYKLQGTAPRTEVLIHAGNWAGDKSLRYKSDSQGCILLGIQRATLDHQPAVTMSRAAVTRLVDHFQREPFLLRILPITPGQNP